MERKGFDPKSKVHVTVFSLTSGKTVERDLDRTGIANLQNTGYTVTEVQPPVFLKPRVPPKGSEEERTAQGEQWWQKD